MYASIKQFKLSARYLIMSQLKAKKVREAKESKVPKPNITDSPVDPFDGLTDRQIERITFENKFNMVMMGIFEHVTKFYSHEDVDSAKEQINSVLMESPSGPISCFLLHVYRNDEYRANLLKQNQSFFTGLLDDGLSNISDTGSVGSTTSDRSDRSSLSDMMKDKMILDKIFSFKKIWSSFTSNTKIFIMRSLRGMVLISTEYIKMLD